MPDYKRPPITEAVIEIRFEKKVPFEIVKKAVARFAPDFSHQDKISVSDVQVDVQRPQLTKVIEKLAGHKLSSSDRTDVLQVTTDFISSSRLSPYSGWGTFAELAQKNWRAWKRIASYHKLKRIGVRYINRLDIPSPPGQSVKVEDYLTVYPSYSDRIAARRYMMQVVGRLETDECQVILNSAIVPSPLVNHLSVTFDLDIYRESDVPQSDDEIWGLINQMRALKNAVFEESITDKARELFS